MRATDYRTFGFFKFLSPGQRNLSVSRATFVIVTLVVMVIGCLISAIRSSSLEQRLHNWKQVHIATTACMLVITQCVNHKRLSRFFDFIDECHTRSRYDFPEESTIMSQSSAITRKRVAQFTVVMLMDGLLAASNKQIAGVISGSSWRQLAVPWTIPSDDDLAFVVALLFQTVAIGFIYCTGVLLLCFSTITTQTIAVFDVIIISLEQIEKRADRLMVEKGLTYQESMEACLLQTLAHFRQLTEEMLSIKPYLDSSFFAPILNCSLIMALQIYPLLQKDVTMAAAGSVLVLVAADGICVAVFCNEMEAMSERSTRVFQALYGTPWYQCGAGYRRLILNGLTASLQPIMIRGGHFLEIKATRATFYSAMQSSFTILNIVRNLN